MPWSRDGAAEGFMVMEGSLYVLIIEEKPCIKWRWHAQHGRSHPGSIVNRKWIATDIIRKDIDHAASDLKGHFISPQSLQRNANQKRGWLGVLDSDGVSTYPTFAGACITPLEDSGIEFL